MSTHIHIVGTHQKCLTEALLMSTYNVCLHGVVRKIFIWIFFLSGVKCTCLLHFSPVLEDTFLLDKAQFGEYMQCFNHKSVI